MQCLSGHVHEVISSDGGDTELEQRCKSRTALDALILGPDDCPVCIEDARTRARTGADMCSLAGCPVSSPGDEDAPCAKTCLAVLDYREIKDSPYNDQLRFMPPGPDAYQYY